MVEETKHTFVRRYSASHPEERALIPEIIRKIGNPLLTEAAFRKGHVLRFRMTVKPTRPPRGYDIFWRVQIPEFDYYALCICILVEDGSHQFLNEVDIGTKSFWTPKGKYGFIPIRATIDGATVTYRFKDGKYQ